MKMLLPVLLLALLPVVVAGQSPNVIARNCAPNSSEAIFDQDGRGSTDTVPQAQLKIASLDARASHPPRDDVNATTLAVLGTPNVIARNCAFNSSEAIFDPNGRRSTDTVPQAQLKIASPDARASHPSRDDVHATTLAVLGAPNVIARNCAFNSSEAIFDSDGRGSTDTVPQAQLKIASPDARASHPSRDDVNATTLAVLRANRPKGMAEADWLKMMQEPVNQALFPLRITQAMLDTLDGREMDLRFRYVLVSDW